MNSLATVEMEAPGQTGLLNLHFPFGLLGFEATKDFVLISEPDAAPFSWLQVVNDPSLAFIVISPFDVLADYEPDLAQEDVDSLNLTAPRDALLYCIVTLRGGGRATVNLKGPIVINRHTARAKQVVLANAARYPLQHPLLTTLER